MKRLPVCQFCSHRIWPWQKFLLLGNAPTWHSVCMSVWSTGYLSGVGQTVAQVNVALQQQVAQQQVGKETIH